MTREVDPARCPLCGEPNQCALAADPSASECWCDSKTFPRELFAHLPNEAIRRVCICQKCLERYLENGTTVNSPS
jgi:hypothetical protein